MSGRKGALSLSTGLAVVAFASGLAWSLALTGYSQTALAQDAAVQEDRLKDVEKALAEDRKAAQDLGQKAEALRQEIAGLRKELIAAASKSQDLEVALSESEARLAALETEQTEKTAALASRQDQLAKTLVALQRIALRPPDSLLAAPEAPVDTLRSAMLMSYAVPQIEERAQRLRSDLEALDALREEIRLEQANLAEAQSALDGERRRLTTLVERKKDLEAGAAAAQEDAQLRAKKHASQAESLRDLLARLEQEAAEAARLKQQAEEAARKEAEQRAAEAKAAEEEAARQAALSAQEQSLEPPSENSTGQEAPSALTQDQQALVAPGLGERPDNVRNFPASPETAELVLPARGPYVGLFGQPDAASGELSKGLSILTRDAAQVVAPFDGQVAYAGRFRGYGQILIIEHSGRYHTLLAGLERVDAVEGQWVLAGEPVGIMNGSASGEPVLYLELRRTGQPINPLPWLAKSEDKVQG